MLALVLTFPAAMAALAQGAATSASTKSAPPPGATASAPAAAPTHSAPAPAHAPDLAKAGPTHAGLAAGATVPYRGDLNGQSRVLIPPAGQASVRRKPAHKPPRRSDLATKSNVCHLPNGSIYYLDTPCPTAGSSNKSKGYWDGAEPGELYTLNFWIMPGTPGISETGATGAGGATQQRLLGGGRLGAESTGGPRAAWIQDPGANGVGMPTTKEQQQLPVQTRLSDTPVSYAVVLRDGTALASVVPPWQSGAMIVGKDRTGHLYSVRASEVDKAASRLPDTVSTIPNP